MNLQTLHETNEGNMTYRIKLDKYFDIYINRVKNNSTKQNYISSFKIIASLQTIKINEIVDFILKNIHKFENNNTKNFHLRNLMVFLKWLATNSRQAYDFKSIEFFKEPLALRQAYTADELLFLEQELKAYGNKKFYVAWHIILANDLRRSEFCAIDWNAFKNNNWKMQLYSAKRGKNKRVRVPKFLIPKVANLNFDILPNTLSFWFDRFDDFVKERNPEFKKPIMCHMLKHTATTRAYIKSGGDLNKVGVFSGNKNLAMLYDVYVQKDDAFLDSIWEEVNDDEAIEPGERK